MRKFSPCLASAGTAYSAPYTPTASAANAIAQAHGAQRAQKRSKFGGEPVWLNHSNSEFTKSAQCDAQGGGGGQGRQHQGKGQAGGQEVDRAEPRKSFGGSRDGAGAENQYRHVQRQRQDRQKHTRAANSDRQRGHHRAQQAQERRAQRQRQQQGAEQRA